MSDRETRAGGAEPRTDRPSMPDGYGVPITDEGLLPWSWAVERLEAARNFWFSTIRPDGRPHVMPAWAAWLDGELYFEGSPATRRLQNVAANPLLVVHLESGDLGGGDAALILEGVARPASPPPRAVAERLAAIFTAKFGESHDYRPGPDQWDRGGLWAMRPTVAFGWTQFPTTTTRWRFPNPT